MLASVYERKKLKRLEEKGIVIETLYYNVNQTKGKIYTRATDGKILDNVTDKAIKEKRYFKNDGCIYREDNFNPRIHYTIKTYQNEDEDIKCPNCGNRGKVKDFIDNCPYCNTNFNFGISDTNGSIREKRNKMYKALSKKDQKNFWKSEKNEKTFYNDLYKEIVSYLYCQKDLIDFDILDYNELEFINETEIGISCNIRKITYQDKIKTEKRNLIIKMKYQDSNKKDENYKVINCSNCGASIDISKKECIHCGKIININNEWIAEKIIEK